MYDASKLDNHKRLICLLKPFIKIYQCFCKIQANILRIIYKTGSVKGTIAQKFSENVNCSVRTVMTLEVLFCR